MIRGTITAMATPFDAEGNLDVGKIGKLATWLAERGVDAVFVAGTTGEGLLLSMDERRRLTEATVQAVGGRIKVLTQVGCASTADSITMAEYAAAAGTDGVVALSPCFFKVDDLGMVAHFEAVAAAVPHTPFYLYNIPGNTRNNISVGVVRALMDTAPNFAGIKDSSKDLELLQKFVEIAHSDFAVLVGSDSVLLEGMEIGAVGVVSAASNVFPEAVVKIVRAIEAGDHTAARAAQDQLNKLLGILKMGPALAGYKAGLAMRGMDVGGMRPPLRDMTPDELASFEEAFSAVQQ
jgi:4-hydroxy-tetrahydrodipicolinate synthase